jgi:hypothetical protein
MNRINFNTENYVKEEIKFNLISMNLFSVAALIFAGLFFGIPFFLLRPEKLQVFKQLNIFEFTLQERIINVSIYLLIVIPGIVLHEVIHGLFFIAILKKGLSSIKFGIHKLTPYCTFFGIMRVKSIIIALIMPTIILGIIPSIISLIIGSIRLLLIGIVFILVGGGDLYMVFKPLLAKVDSSCWVENHPSDLNATLIYRPKLKQY